MKIAFIGQKGIPAKNGGVEKYVESLALQLVRNGQEVLVYSRRNYSQEIKEYKGIKIIPLPTLPGKNFEAISQTFFACLDLMRRKVDVIHVHSIGPASLILFIKILKPRTPIVFTFQCQDYYHQKWGRLARWYLKFGEKIGCLYADKIITISAELSRYTLEKYKKQSIYIPNGSSINEKTPVRDIRRWGLNEENYFVSISRLVRHKGIHYLIEAYKQLNTDKKLVIVGDSSYTDDYVQELYSLAGDNPNIIFTGNQTSHILRELYSNAFVFVQPSESEGLSLALLEAMSYARPCLVSDIEANTVAIKSAGYVFVNKDVTDLKNKLQLILDNPAEAKAKGEQALERVRKEYNWEDISAKILDIYKSVIK